MIWHIGKHRTDDAEVIGAFPHLGKNFTHLQSRLAVFLKLVGGTICGARLAFRGQAQRNFPAVPFVQRGLGVEGVDLRRSAIGENVDDMLGFAGLVCGTHRQGIGGLGGFLKKRAECQRAQSHAAAIQEIAAREKKVFGIVSVMTLHAGS